MKTKYILGIYLILYLSVSFSQSNSKRQNKSVEEKLLYSTIRINTVSREGNKIIYGSGTGLFFNFADSDSVSRPYLITNKHVIENTLLGVFEFVLTNKYGEPDTITQRIVLENFSKLWIYHPDPKIDLCILPIANLENEAILKKVMHYYIMYDLNNIPNDNEWEKIDAIQKVLIVGYPIGLIDTLNNIPLIRTGTTATPPYLNFNGRSEFVIDAGCFPGSSGSPIIYLPDMFVELENKVKRPLLLGILYAGPVMKVSGEITTKKISTSIGPIAETLIPINLGYIIKSTRIKDFKQIIDKK